MFTVALIGPDGSGKSTVARGLADTLPMPVKYLYMGVNWDASNYLLPTTRVVERAKDSWIRRSRGRRAAAGRPADADGHTGGRPSRPGALRRLFRAGWVGLYVMNLLTEEWYRQIVAWRHVRGGGLVVFDRHFFFDFYTGDVAGGAARKFHQKFHGFLLARVYPKPDLVIYLDAPADVLFARKGEGTVEWLEQRKREYLDLGRAVEHFVVVDASRPLEDVIDDVGRTILAFAPASATQTSRKGLTAGKT